MICQDEIQSHISSDVVHAFAPKEVGRYSVVSLNLTTLTIQPTKFHDKDLEYAIAIAKGINFNKIFDVFLAIVIDSEGKLIDVTKYTPQC